MTGREESFVLFYVPKFETSTNFRKKLGILSGERVFGRHWWWDTFNIPFARRAVAEHARKHRTDHFIFLNTEPIHGTERLSNVHYLPATVDPEEKAQFLASCDTMLHARWHGETFGLAVGEFAALGKPVITFEGSRERAHLEMLGDRALRYCNRAELEEILCSFTPRKASGTVYEEFANPNRVMDLFRKIFLL